MTNYDETLTTAEAAKILGVTPRRVIALIRQHNRAATREAIAKGYVAKWVGRKPGRDWLLTRAEVELIRPRPTAGRPPSKPRGEVMKNHWVQVRVDHGELVAGTEENTDLYLTVIRVVQPGRADLGSPTGLLRDLHRRHHRPDWPLRADPHLDAG